MLMIELSLLDIGKGSLQGLSQDFLNACPQQYPSFGFMERSVGWVLSGLTFNLSLYVYMYVCMYVFAWMYM